MSSPTQQVLIIEDSLICQEIYKAIFRRINCPIDMVDSAATGIALAKAFRYDCILVDWGLPDCGDNSLITAIRATAFNQSTPIFVISAHAAEDIMQAWPSLEVQGVYSKPLIPREIETLVRPYLWA